MKWFKNKRKQVAHSLSKNSVLILASLPEYFRQVDIKYPYRQDSNFYYLTGFEQALSLFLLFPSGKSVLFTEDKNPVKELWEGPLYSITEIKKNFLIDQVYPLSQLDVRLKFLLKGKSKLFYDMGGNGSNYSPTHPVWSKKLKALKIPLESADEKLKPLRRTKDRVEIALIEKAISISVYAHQQVAKALKPNISERELHGIFIKSIMEKGAQREAYGGIFASGANGTILHYTQNRSICKKGELLLVDAGAEKDYYSSDISRVYPVSGRFSKSQKALYNELLNLQKKLIKTAQPGLSLRFIHQKMAEGLTDILLRWGFLKGSFRKNLKSQAYKKYCPHGVGHLLGLDVHDPPFKKGDEDVLQPGMTLTIEPGIYISKSDKKAKEDLRGLGLRIEDDILIGIKGQKNLTKALVKSADEIEELCSS